MRTMFSVCGYMNRDPNLRIRRGFEIAHGSDPIEISDLVGPRMSFADWDRRDPRGLTESKRRLRDERLRAEREAEREKRRELREWRASHTTPKATPKGTSHYGWHERPVGMRANYRESAYIPGDEANLALQSGRHWCNKYAPHLCVRQHYNRDRGVTTLWLEERAV